VRIRIGDDGFEFFESAAEALNLRAPLCSHRWAALKSCARWVKAVEILN
jgi:hypothetical protein